MSERIKHLNVVVDEGETEETYTVHRMEGKRRDSCYFGVSYDEFKSVASQFVKSSWSNVSQLLSSNRY